MKFSESPCAKAPYCVLRVPLQRARHTTDYGPRTTRQLPTLVESFVDFRANEPTKDSTKVPDHTLHAPRSTRPLLSSIPFLLLTLVFVSVPACKPKSSDEFIRLTN